MNTPPKEFSNGKTERSDFCDSVACDASSNTPHVERLAPGYAVNAAASEYAPGSPWYATFKFLGQSLNPGGSWKSPRPWTTSLLRRSIVSYCASRRSRRAPKTSKSIYSRRRPFSYEGTSSFVRSNKRTHHHHYHHYHYHREHHPFRSPPRDGDYYSIHKKQQILFPIW